MTTPRPTHLDQHDPAKADVRDIRDEVDREIEAYARDLHDLVLLVPEDRWEEFLRLSGCAAADDTVRYKGVVLKKGPITAVVAQEGF
ncbi:MAG: hypothetical protein JWP50_2589 [Phenylobacterium sp.]|nr:hypothetical protein [Phenylobacterium sp.]